MATEFFQVEVIKETWDAKTGTKISTTKTTDRYGAKFCARDAYFDKWSYYEKRRKLNPIDGGEEVYYTKEDKKYWHMEKLYGYTKTEKPKISESCISLGRDIVVGITVRISYRADEWTGLNVDEECRQSRTRFKRIWDSLPSYVPLSYLSEMDKSWIRSYAPPSTDELRPLPATKRVLDDLCKSEVTDKDMISEKLEAKPIPCQFPPSDEEVNKKLSFGFDKDDEVKPVPIKWLNGLHGRYYVGKWGIKDVIFHAPATIVIWKDGTKTVVKAQDGEKYDPEKGLAMAICKKNMGNNHDYYDVFKHWLKKVKKEKK